MGFIWDLRTKEDLEFLMVSQLIGPLACHLKVINSRIYAHISYKYMYIQPESPQLKIKLE